MFPLDKIRCASYTLTESPPREGVTYSGSVPAYLTRRAHPSHGLHDSADVEVPAGGGDGMLVTEGGRFGGYGLYLLKGKPVFLYNMVDWPGFRGKVREAPPASIRSCSTSSPTARVSARVARVC